MNRPLYSTLCGVLGVFAVSGVLFAMSHGDAPSLPEDLDDFEHVNTLVVPDAGSPIHGFHHFYVDDRGREIFRNGGSDEYPDGTVFVGKVYAPGETAEGRYQEGDLVAYTLMEKDAGSQTTHATGGWHFVMLDAEGEPKRVDPVEACFGCHEPSPETDFVLSTPLG